MLTDGFSSSVAESLYPLKGRVPSLLNPVHFGPNSVKQVNQGIFTGIIGESIDTIKDMNNTNIIQNSGISGMSNGIYDITRPYNSIRDNHLK